MIPADFDYVLPATLTDALAQLAKGAGTVALAGGQTLIPRLTDREIAPSLVVDISRLAELRGITIGQGWLVIGAGVTFKALMTDEIDQAAALLRAVLPSVGSGAIRNRGTVGGNLAAANPHSELPVALLALDARLVLRDAAAQREVSIETFFRGAHRTALGDGELITEIRIPLAERDGTASAFSEISARAGAPPLACVAVWLACGPDGVVSAARIAAGGVCEAPARCRAHEAAVIGHPVSQSLARLSKAADAGLQPSTALPNSDYALDVLPTLIRRAATAAIAHYHNPA